MKIVADDKIPFLKGALEPFAEVVYVPGKEISGEIARNADALLIRTRTKCNEKLLKETNVRFIGTATIGYDHIDTSYCEKNNITWTNAPGCNSSSVQQYITAALLKIAHDKRFSLKNKTLGIVGVGNVGSKVERAARILGMNVLLNDPPRAEKEGTANFVSLEELIAGSDIITVHVPLNLSGKHKTYHLFDKEKFQLLNKGTWFFNSSRGEVAETEAFKHAIKSGKINAVVDVWENEPDIDPELMSLAYITTPHIAGYSTDGKANGTSMVVNSLSAFFGLPLKQWYPVNVPAPQNPVIEINGKNKTDDEILYEAVMQTYSIESDHMRLRNSPETFEKQRGDYPLRREFPAYNVLLKSASESAVKKLSMLGFKIVS
jgi:erythronate-4-phosphate dehydrogenase